MGMMEITKLCGYLRGWRIGCAPIYIEETTNLVALEACRAAMRGSPELSSIGQLLREVNCLDPLDVGRAGRPRLFAWFRLLMHLTHVWETLARIDPAGQVACTRSFTQDPSGAMRLQSNRLEKVLDSGRALNGIAAAFGGSLGIIMLLPETFTTWYVPCRALVFLIDSNIHVQAFTSTALDH